MGNESGYVRRLVDEARLREYLESTLGAADTFEIERHQAGHSNETFFITWGSDKLVLRRPPAGETADRAHDVGREYRVMHALADSDVPVPEMVAFCEDDSVLGAEFFLMEQVEGDVVRLEEPDRFAEPEHRQRIGEELVDGLAAIHQIDYESVGLGEFGYPEGFMQRQIDRWEKQLEWAVGKTDRGDQLPHRRELESWLEENCPTDTDTTLVHGDYKLDNTIIGPGTPPTIDAVVDWEMSTLGDPLSDLGWTLVFWHDDPEIEPVVPELVPGFTAREGYPTRGEVVARYESRTGRTVTDEDVDFYTAFATYKLAAVCEMFYARYLSGNSENPVYPAMNERVPSLFAYATAAIDGHRDW
jgi:aminoglycoside phosphotransferase (APT) family kinase protein